MLGGDLGQLVHEIGSELRGILDQLLVADDRQRSPSDCGRQRTAAKSAAVLAGGEKAHQGFVGQDGRDRVEAARESLADDGHIRPHALMLSGEELAGAAQAGLDLIQDEQDILLLAEFRDLLEVAGWGDQHAAFALDGLEHDGAGVGGDGLFERGKVTVFDGDEAGCEGSEIVLVVLVARE
jgi:hypothetical protein